MSVATDKYRGTTKYFHVFAELVRAAQYRGLTTYQDIALLMDLPQSGSHMGKEVGRAAVEVRSMTATDVIAVVAIFVSVITAWTSWVSAQKTAERQQTFELRFYRLSMLDPAKGALRRILIDSNRRTNVAVQVQGGFSAQDFEALKLLDREAVNTVSRDQPSPAA